MARRFTHNYIYSFDYPTPVSPVKSWDLNPLNLLLKDDGGINVLMLNLHFLPTAKIRSRFIEYVIDNSRRLSSRRLSSRRLIKIVYQMLSSHPVLAMAKKYSIRKYRKVGIRNLKKISKDDLLRLDTSTRFNMAKLNRIYPKKKIVTRK